MAQGVKALATQTWQPEFDLQVPLIPESCLLAVVCVLWYTHTYTHKHAINKYLHK